VTEELEQTAQQIADRGREALIERLRPAFRDAASQHSDVLELNDEQLEQMVQRAADRADGLQWRRALASVATDQLGIGLGEALTHPAVERAQAIVGAPSYEESLAALTARRQAEAEANGAGGTEEEEPEADEVEALADEADADEAEGDFEVETEMAAPEPAPEPELEAEAPVQPTAEHEAIVEAPDSIRVAVIHLGGVANLEPGEGDIELRLSEVGLDIVRGMDETLGRLTWQDIRELSVPPPRGLRLLRRESRAHLVVRTDNGDASFEVPAVAPDELREHLTQLIERHGQAIAAT
jgi:hypothetical protein